MCMCLALRLPTKIKKWDIDGWVGNTKIGLGLVGTGYFLLLSGLGELSLLVAFE